MFANRAEKNEKETEVTIRGTVEPQDWDAEDKVVAVALLTDEGNRYEIERRGLGRILLRYLNAEVEVTGTVHNPPTALNPMLRVLDFTRLSRR